MPRYTVVIETDDPDRFLPGSWPIDVASKDPGVVILAAQELCESEHVRLVRVIANSTGKEVKP
jgi:hypothetical protein